MRLNEAVASSLAYLRSPEAAESLARDPYWPKWHSPWWHLLALDEAGVPPPREAIAALVERASAHYLRFFPRAPEVLPAGKSARTDVMCFCGLGSLQRLGHVDWAPDFIARYQLEDGGWNCDEHSSKCSVVSTVPVLEYLVAKEELSPAERTQLDRGIAYLLSLKLFLSRRTRKVLSEAWLTPALPRFYEYDVLRGLTLVTRWSKRFGTALPALDEAREVVQRWTQNPTVRHWASSEDARKTQGVESTFPLCDVLGRPDVALPLLLDQAHRT